MKRNAYAFMIAALVGLFFIQPVQSQIVNPTNANNVLYTAPYTGGVRETQAAKNARYIDIKDFGCIGNGIADDTLCIQNFFDAIFTNNGGIGRITRGTYLFTSDIVPQINGTTSRFFIIEGEGMETSRLITNNASSLKIYADTPPARNNAFVNVILRSFEVSNTGTLTNACIDVYSLQRSLIDNIRATGCNYGIKLRSSWNITITGRSQFVNNNVGIKVPADGGGINKNEGVNALDIHGISAANNTQAGISLSDGNAISIRDVLLESTPVGVYLLQAIKHISVDTAYLELGTTAKTRTNRAGALQAFSVYTGSDENSAVGNTSLPITDLNLKNIMSHFGEYIMYIDNVQTARIANNVERSYITLGSNATNIISDALTGNNDLTTSIVPGIGRSIANNNMRKYPNNIIPNGDFSLPGLPYATLSAGASVSRTTQTLNGSSAHVLALTCPNGQLTCTMRIDAIIPAGAQFGVNNVNIVAATHFIASSADVSAVTLSIANNAGTISSAQQTTGLTSWSELSLQGNLNTASAIAPYMLLTVTVTRTTGTGAVNIYFEQITASPLGQNTINGTGPMDLEVGLSGSGTTTTASGGWFYSPWIVSGFGDIFYFDVLATAVYDGLQTATEIQIEKGSGADAGKFRVWSNKNGVTFNYRMMPRVTQLP